MFPPVRLKTALIPVIILFHLAIKPSRVSCRLPVGISRQTIYLFPVQFKIGQIGLGNRGPSEDERRSVGTVLALPDDHTSHLLPALGLGVEMSMPPWKTARPEEMFYLPNHQAR